MSVVCESQPFDTEQFGVPVVRLRICGNVTQKQFAQAVRQHIGAWRAEGVWLASCRIPSTETTLAEILSECGFRHVETLITLSRHVTPNLPSELASVSPATPDDIPGCMEIARVEFHHDRYHADPEIDRGAADRLKAQWVKNSMLGRADAVFVTRDDVGPSGFLLCNRTADKAIIDLIAVAKRSRGKGLGMAMIGAALQHYSGVAATMLVGTQAENLASLALYRRCAFVPSMRSLTFHWSSQYR
ncbi:MAG: GNAT family N-acetyltransferase [Planctomycetes bacterium]|nr:GNAT family N-acetyltransferase [Planctomycetota bacterium]